MAHRKGRSVLTGAGIVLGVAILFGVFVANATTQKGVDNLIEDWTGRADVVAGPVGTFDADLPDGTIAKLRALPQVRDVVGDIGFGTTLPEKYREPDADDGGPFGADANRIGVVGIDPAQAKKIQNYRYVAGRDPRPGADEIIISQTLADETGLRLGDTLEIKGRSATRNLTIVGVLEPSGAGRINEGHATYTSIGTARVLDGKGPQTYGSASVILTKGVDVDEWIEDHRDALPAVRLQNAETLAAGFKEFLEVFGTFLTFFAAITLFVGAFLIYLTLSMAVIERTRMYGTLRALGATSRQVRRVVLREAIALGTVSTLAGLVFGLVLALGLLQLIGNLFDLDMPGLVIRPSAVVSTVVIGMLVTIGSALIPARRAGKLAPVEAMKGDYARETRLGRMWMAGAVLLVASIALVVTGGDALSSLGVIGILLGAVLVVPVLLRPLAAALGLVTNRIARGVGEIAVLHLAKERSRSAYTLALVMVVMAMLFAVGGLYLSVRAGIDELVDRQFGADLFVGAQVPEDGALGRELAKRPEVEHVSPIRFGFSTLVHDGDREEVFVRTIEPESYFEISSYFWKEGDDASAKAALIRGDAVLVNTDVSREYDAKVGTKITLETTKGNRTFDVVATYAPNPGPPEITMGIKDARRYLSAGRPQGYGVNIRDGEDPLLVAERIEESLARFEPGVETLAQTKEEARSQVATYFQIVYAILLIAAIVGLLGLANTLAMSVLQRFREIGILRAIGVTRSQAWRMVLVESATMGLTAFVLSIPLGGLLTYLVISGTSDGFGFQIPTIYPWSWVPFVAAFAIVIAVIAAIAPGRRAARLHVVNALQYE